MSEILQSQPWKPNNGGRAYSGHIAVSSSSVDTPPAFAGLGSPASLNTAINNYNIITDGTLVIGTSILNTLTLNPSTNTAGSFAAQNGLIEIASGNTVNYTGAVYGDAGSLYHYGSGTIATAAGIVGQTQINGAGGATAAAAGYFVNIHKGSGAITDGAAVYARNILWPGNTTTTNNQYGIWVDTSLRLGGTVTNNYGVYIADQGSVATNNYNIYSAGSTSKNYFVGRVIGGSIGANTGSNAAIARLDVRTPSGDYTTPIMNLHSDNATSTTNGWNFWIGGDGDYSGSLKIHDEGQPQDSWSLKLNAAAEGYGVSSTYGFAAPEFRSSITGRGDAPIMKYTTDGANNFSGHVDIGQPYLGGAAPATYFSTRAYVGKTATSLFEIRNWTDDTALLTVQGTTGTTSLFPTAQTLTSLVPMIQSTTTHTIDFASAVAPVGFDFSSTMIFKQNGYVFGSGILFWARPTIQNDSASTRTIGPWVGFASQPVYQANGGSLTGQAIDFAAKPTFNRINSGTTSIANHYNFWAQGGDVSTGATVTNRYGFLFQETGSVTGTLTSSAALVSVSLSGTNKTHLLMGTSTIPSGTWGIYQASTETNLLSGDLNFIKETARTIQIQDTTTAATAGAALTILGAKGSNTTSGTGGAINVTGGDGRQGNSSGGAITLTGGTGVGISTGGAVTLVGGGGLTGGTVNIDAGSGVANGTVKIGVTRGDVYVGKTGGKVGFLGATPVVQPATTGTTTGFTAGSGTGVNDDSTFTGGTGSSAYRISDIVLALKQLGLLAA